MLAMTHAGRYVLTMFIIE